MGIYQSVLSATSLILVPYLIAHIGLDSFGLWSYILSIVAYLCIITDFGFNLSATREISIARHDRIKLSKIFSTIMVLKIFLFFFSVCILLLGLCFFSKLREHWSLYLLSIGIILGQTFHPIWFFQGLEKGDCIAYPTMVSKVVTLILVFVLIKSSYDLQKLVFVHALCSVFLSIWSVYKAIKVSNLFWVAPSMYDLLSQFRDGFQFFISRVSVSLYTVSNLFILGFYVAYSDVASYSIAEKICAVLISLYQPISSALYPYMSKEKNIKLFKRFFYGLNIVNLSLIFSLVFFLDFILSWVLKSTENSGYILEITQIYLISALFSLPSILLGYPLLAASGYPSHANLSVMFSAVFHLVLLIALIFINNVNPVSIAWAVVITSIVDCSIRVYAVYKLGLWRSEKKLCSSF
jgi:PST family polysaccharide transporter